MFSILTRDLGMIQAIAQGIRFEKSKLRYHVRDQWFGTFSLVKGKEFWRLISAEESGFNSAKIVPSLMSRIASLLKRLLHGEEPHAELFQVLLSANVYISRQSNLTGRSGEAADLRENVFIDNLETLVVARILHRLGYIGHVSAISDF